MTPAVNKVSKKRRHTRARMHRANFYRNGSHDVFYHLTKKTTPPVIK